MNLNDRLYTSTEVAEILGVSLRSVYRYLEDGKLNAEIKTATGRLRFTKQNILDFLHPGESASSVVERHPVEKQDEEVSVPERKSQPKVAETEEEEDVDWLSRFKASAEKFRKEQEDAQAAISKPAVEKASEDAGVVPEPKSEPLENFSGLAEEVEEDVIEEAPTGKSVFYYRSLSGGLKDVAQNIDRVARRSNVDYAFTLNAGLSLYKPLKNPFSVLHAYIRSQDRDLFEKLLRLVPSDEANAQLCLIFSDEAEVFNTKLELHGLFVVSKDQLKKDIESFGKYELIEELEAA